ncbi:MAG: hypothetical protein HKN09_00925 [Saprospiraceae bacterium]|nr:hypothetical protein [Saprospiraceae bacterium]
MRRDLIALHPESKVWVYASNKLIPDAQIAAIKQDIVDFTMQWQSHGQNLDCYGNIFHERFLVLVADDTHHVSGCSIDSSVHFVKALEAKYNLNFFDRMTYHYVVDEVFHTIHHSQLKAAYNEGTINDDTLMVDNLVNTKETFLERWIVPLNMSWYKKLLS